MKKASIILVIVLLTLCDVMKTALSNIQPNGPHFQYFERPKYRFPYYDENGRGKLLYGYGGPQLHQYKTYSVLEGIH